jgi:uncharacterized protein (TIGR01777 family)
MNYLITGGTGFIGSNLKLMLLKEGHNVTVITRNPDKYRGEQAKNQTFISWNDDLTKAMNDADVVINLVGENLFKIWWTDAVKKTLRESRVNTTKTLVEAMKKAEKKPEVLISASGISYYGNRGDQLLDESSEAGDDFLAKLCIDWEREALKAVELDIRTAVVRISPALQDGGGMIEKMKPPFLLFVGGPVGSGRQYVPWIHMKDLCRAILHPVENQDFEGPYNACSPEQVTMNELADVMGKVLNRPSFFRVPEFVLNTMLGESATPVVSSLRVQPKKLQVSGFEFEFENLEEALSDAL